MYFRELGSVARAWCVRVRWSFATAAVAAIFDMVDIPAMVVVDLIVPLCFMPRMVAIACIVAMVVMIAIS